MTCSPICVTISLAASKNKIVSILPSSENARNPERFLKLINGLTSPLVDIFGCNDGVGAHSN